MATSVYAEDFSVRYSECDLRDQLKLRAVFDYFQETAGTHADKLGFGWKWMLDHNMIWVLSRMKLRINRRPELGERFTVRTYPSGSQRLFALRQFQMLDGAGNSVAEAGSWWLVISADRHRPMKLSNLGTAIPENPDEPVYFATPDEFDFTGLPELFQTDVRFSAIDVNHHLNNAEYSGFVQDALEMLSPGCGLPHEMQINYLAAQTLGAKIKIGGQIRKDGFRIEGVNASGTVCFQAAGKFA